MSLTFSKDDIIIKKEKICDNCQNEKKGKETITLAEFLNQLPEAEQDAALIHLLVERSKKKGGYESVGQNPSLSQLQVQNYFRMEYIQFIKPKAGQDENLSPISMSSSIKTARLTNSLSTTRILNRISR